MILSLFEAKQTSFLIFHRLLYDLFPARPPLNHESEGHGSKMGDRGLISRKMLLLSGPAVFFSRRVLKLLKLTYYLLDWANMFVFRVHVCVQVLIFSCTLIKCTVVIADKSQRNDLLWVSREPYCMASADNREC